MSQTILPQRLQDALARLGEPEAVFRPFAGRLAVGLGLGAAFVVLGVVAAVAAWNEGTWDWLAFGVLLSAAGVALVWWLRRSWGQRLLVCPGGLVWQRRAGVESLRWAEVGQVVEVKWRSVVGGELKELYRYRVEPKHGDPWPLDAVQVKAIKKLAALLKQKAEQHSIPWTIEVVEHES